MESLVNGLWQAALITIAVRWTVGAVPSVSATSRCRIWWTTLIVAAALPVLPLAFAAQAASGTASAATASDAVTTSIVVLPVPGALVRLFVGVWVIVGVVSLLRIGLALRSLGRARRASSPLPRGRELRLAHWARLRNRGRRVKLMVSDAVGMPAFVGCGAPIICLPPWVLEQLSDEDVDRVVAHEYAHAQRWDDYGALAQALIHAIAWWNPAVRWIDRRLGLEREVACDDWVVATFGAAKRYARCLTSIATTSLEAEPTLAPAAVRRRPQLAHRVRRLLDGTRNRDVRCARPTVAAASSAVLLLACLLSPVRCLTVVDRGISAAPTESSTVDSGEDTGSIGGDRQSTRMASAPPPAATDAAPVEASSDRLMVQQPARQAPGALPVGRPRDPPAPTSPPLVPAALAEIVPQAAVAGEPARHLAPLTPLPTSASSAITPGLVPADSNGAEASAQRAPDADPPVPTPWGAAARAGASLGAGSRKAAVSTGGFFKRLGQSIGASF